jgi:hypothetical protein
VRPWVHVPRRPRRPQRLQLLIISIVDFENNKIDGSTIKRGDLVVVKTTIHYWEFNEKKDHGFSNQLVRVKLLKLTNSLKI